MLYRFVGLSWDFIHRRVRRGSKLWKVLAAIWAGWLACEPIYRRRAWKRSEEEFERLLALHSTRAEDFFFIQIGAFDGLMADPIHAWIKGQGKWRGILVEPQAREFERLKVTYQEQEDRLIFENLAIADRNGVCTLYRVKESPLTEEWERGLASLLPQDQSRFIAEVVPCITFDALLDRHCVKRLDLLQIDVEGYDYEILKLVDFRRVRPRLIRYEHRHLAPGDKHACKVYLRRQGYEVLEMQFDTGAFIPTPP